MGGLSATTRQTRAFVRVALVAVSDDALGTVSQLRSVVRTGSLGLTETHDRHEPGEFAKVLVGPGKGISHEGESESHGQRSLLLRPPVDLIGLFQLQNPLGGLESPTADPNT